MQKEKYRYVSTAFWDDSWIQTIDPSEKLLYLYLLTNPLTNIAGIYKITIRRICFDTGFNADTVTHILRKFETAKKVFTIGDWVVLPNWPKHQKISERDNNRKGIDYVLENLPDEVFQFVVEHGYEYDFLKHLKRYKEGACKGLTSSSNYININLNSNLNSNSNNNIIEAQQASPPVPSKAIVKSENDQLYQYIKNAFEKVHGDFADYAKEGAAIKRIIKLTNGDAEAVRLMLQTFYRLYKSNDKYWSSIPFIPSRLAASGIWEGVKEVAMKTIAAADTSWVDEIGDKQ